MRSLIVAFLTVALLYLVCRLPPASAIDPSSDGARGASHDTSLYADPCGTIVVKSRHLCAEFTADTDPAYITAKLHELRTTPDGQGDGQSRENFTPDTRWPGTPGDPIKLTWSFVPDGTREPSCPSGCPNVSSLFQTFDSQFPSRSAWVSVFEQAFARWDQLTGITFERIVVANDADDGSDITPSTPNNDGPADGAPALRGDIRIRAIALDGPGGLLSFGNFPDDIYHGDITFDTTEISWLTTNWTTPTGAGFPRAAAHEIGHAIGLGHVCPFTPNLGNTKLMEWAPANQINYYGPQHDDLRGAQRHYGDPNENNDTLASATIIALPSQTIVDDFHVGAIPFHPAGSFGPVGTENGLLSLDGQQDVDFYQINLFEPSRVSLLLRPVGLSYQSCGPNPADTCDPLCTNFVDSNFVVDLGIQVLDRTGRIVLREGTTINTGVTQQTYIHAMTTPFFIKVFPVGPRATSFTTPQCYDISIDKVSDPGFGCPSSFTQCNDGDSTNGVESCSGGICYVHYNADCNQNFIEDAADVQGGASLDCDLDGIPDECQNDCNGNGRGDACDIALGASFDRDQNLVPDECQPDCNANEIVDSYDIAVGPSLDANNNEVPDECETIRRVPADYPTINAAVQNANNGDTILIAAGTWTGPQNKNVRVIDKTLQIRGNTPFDTVIDMQNSGRAFWIESTTGNPADNRTSVQRLQFVNGSPTDYGGAILVYRASTLIERCIFAHNQYAFGGSAIAYAGVCTNEVRSCIFWQNQSSFGGGAVLLFQGPAVAINHCTFVGNSGQVGGAVYAVAAPSGGAIRNCIIRSNSPSNSQIATTPGVFGFIVEFSDLPIEHQGQYGGGVGNIFVDPLFVNQAAGDLHIRGNSPCRDTGYGGYPAGTKDIDGEARVIGFGIDMGADECKLKYIQ